MFRFRQESSFDSNQLNHCHDIFRKSGSCSYRLIHFLVRISYFLKLQVKKKAKKKKVLPYITTGIVHKLVREKGFSL